MNNITAGTLSEENRGLNYRYISPNFFLSHCFSLSRSVVMCILNTFPAHSHKRRGGKEVEGRAGGKGMCSIKLSLECPVRWVAFKFQCFVIATYSSVVFVGH